MDPPPSVSSLLIGLEGMIDSRVLSDLTIQTKDGMIHAHKFILAARSPQWFKVKPGVYSYLILGGP